MITNHVSELAIDRLLAGELATLDAAALRDHAATCADCSARLDDALVTQRSFATARPALLVRRRRAVPVVIGSLAAISLAVLAWPRERDAVRAKGTAIVGCYVAHGSDVRRAAPIETVVPGDRIELYTTTTEAAWFAAISSDGSVYVDPRRIEAGREQLVPTAIELDATLGTEVVTGVFCGERFDPHAPPADCTRDRFTLVKVPR